MSSTVWSSDDSKTILLTKQVEQPKRKSKLMAVIATVLGLFLVACIAFHNKIFTSSPSTSSTPSAVSKAPIDDCLAVIKSKMTQAQACNTGDAVCGCAVVNSITPTDIAACPANLTDAQTVQAASTAYEAALKCCSGTPSTCDATNLAFYNLLQAEVPMTGTLTRDPLTATNPSGYTSMVTSKTKTSSSTPTPTPTNGAEGLVPSFILGLVMMI